MELPDSVLMLHLNIRSVFLDVISIEAKTNTQKGKFKLLTQKNISLSDIDIYIFHVLTTQKDSYIKEKSIDIYQYDWEDGHSMNANSSKLCAQKISIFSKDDLILKLKNNLFKHKGVMRVIKFNEVMLFIQNCFQGSDYQTDFEVRDIVNSTFSKNKVADELVAKFNF